MGDLVQANHDLVVPTRGKGFIEITRGVSSWLDEIGADDRASGGAPPQDRGAQLHWQCG